MPEQHFGSIVQKTLVNVFENHLSLGESGKQVLRTNQFGQQTLNADWQAEEVVLDSLFGNRLPVRVISEEHGIVDIGQQLGVESSLTGILDGLDGTKVYREGSGRYGTMFSISSGLNPRYGNYLCSGILEYPTGRILLATPGNGTYLLEDDQRTQVRTSGIEIVDPNTLRVEADAGFQGNADFAQKYLRNFKHVRVTDSSLAIYYFDLATGNIDLAISSTRKGNLEMAIAYGVVVEAGGVVTDAFGRSLGSRRYLEFGEAPNNNQIVIASASPELTRKLVRDFSK